MDSKKLDTITMDPVCFQRMRAALNASNTANANTNAAIAQSVRANLDLEARIEELERHIQENPMLVVVEPVAPVVEQVEQVVEPVEPEAPAPRPQYVANWALVPNGTRVKYSRNGFEAFGEHRANGIICGDDGVIHNALSVFARHEFTKLQSQGQLPPGARPSRNAWDSVRFRDHDGWKPFHYIRTLV